ncbi:MAG: phosphoribosylaminoimidazolesuccinocarboxamide synthase [Limnochordales bacterium]|nr:phosphoribosylaminoimidazolesuccinocarboxamide synthase [Limnochordales bacterium]
MEQEVAKQREERQLRPQVTRGERLYEGKAKVVYATSDPELVLIEFKDEATAFDGKKRGTISGKGMRNAAICAVLYRYLQERGIPGHFVAQVDERTLLARKVRIIPLEVVVRNIAAGSFSRRLGWPEGQTLTEPLVEFFYKDDALGDPLLTEEHIRLLGLATEQEVARLKELALQVNRILQEFWQQRGIVLVDFKLEFGKDSTGQILLADEISPDTCRLWDAATGEKLDKDRFRRDLGRVEEAYAEILRRALQGYDTTATAGRQWKVRVLVRLKEGVLDPQGQAVETALRALGFSQAGDVRVGKVIDFTLTALDRAAAERIADEICRRLLANPVMEEYSFGLEEVSGG